MSNNNHQHQQKSQRSIYHEYANRPISTQIDEEPYETEIIRIFSNEASSKKNKSKIKVVEDLQFAEKIQNLPEMPEMVKSLAKGYVETHGPQKDKAQDRQLSNNIRHIHANVIKSLGSGVSIETQSSKNNNVENAIINRSFSQKNIQLGQYQQHSKVKISSKVSELAHHLLDTPPFSDKLYSQSQTNFQKRPQLNLNIQKVLNNLSSAGPSNPISNRLSPLPQKYKEHLPNIIKKKISDATSQSFNFNPSKETNKKLTQKEAISRNIEQIQSNFRSDVSYLKENQKGVLGQATILTTGDRGQDELIETTMGYKNLGKSLIDLPQSLEELNSLLNTYDKKIFGLQRTDQEERIYEQYLHDNFKPLELIKKDPLQKERQLPNLELKQYLSQLHTSRYLQAQSTKNHQHQSPTLFNSQGAGNTLMALERQPPKVSTRPETLSLIQNKLLKRFGEEAFTMKQQQQQSPLPKQKTQFNKSEKPSTLHILDDSASKSRMRLIESLTFTQNESAINMTKEECAGERKQRSQSNNSKSKSPERQYKNNKINGIASLLTGVSQTSSSSQLNLGNPTSRQDAIILIVWFEKMLKMLQQDLPEDQVGDKLYPLLQLTMNICVKELSRQVSVQCLERGLLVQKIFESYTKIIELIHKDHKVKRKALKLSFAEKLDKYIQVLEDQISSQKDQVAQLEETLHRMKFDMDEQQWKLKQGSNLIAKFKKKCFNNQREVENMQRRMKFLEKENEEMRQKCQEQADRLGETLSEMDESERKRMMIRIEQELADEQHDVTQEDLEMVPNQQLIQEDDRATDMGGFDQFLSMTNQGKSMDADTQTEKLTKRHFKTGVTAQKLGIMKDKETYTDMRQFLGPNAVKEQMVVDGQVVTLIRVNDQAQTQGQQEAVAEEEQLQVNEDSESEIDSEESEESSDNEEYDTLNEIAIYDGNNGIQKQNKRKKIMKSFSNQLTLLNHEIQPGDLTEEEMRKLPQFGTQEAHKILAHRQHSEDASLLDLVDEAQLHQELQMVNNSMSSMPHQTQDVQLQAKHKKAKKLKTKKNTLIDIFTKRIRQRIKELVHSEDFNNLSLDNPDFFLKLRTDLVHTSKEIQQINGEATKKDKQVRFQLKLNKEKSSEIKEVGERMDSLEMDNYYLREQIADLMKQLDEYKQLVHELLKMLDKDDSLAEMNIHDIRKHLLMLIDKIYTTQLKIQQNSLQEDEIIQQAESSRAAYHNNQSMGGETNINKDLVEGDQVMPKPKTQKGVNIEELDNSAEEINNQGLGHQSSNRLLMGNLGPKYNSKSKSNKPDNLAKKRAMTRIQQFNIGNNKKKLSPVKGKATHPAYIILRKIQQKDRKKLKDVMPRKMLQRVIYQVYSERGPFENPSSLTQSQQQNNPAVVQMALSQATFQSSMMNQNAAQTSLIEWLYDNFMQKYGLKNVAERKFVQVVSSCLSLADQLPRIRLFGRFLEAATPPEKELPPTEYNRYLEMLEMFTTTILNFRVEDDAERVLIPGNKAIDYYKQKFEQRYLPQDFTKKLKELDRAKLVITKEDIKTQKHLKGYREAIDFDWFAEFVVDSGVWLQEERENQIRDIYLAVDVDANGIMSLSEFQMLMKVFHFKSAKEIWRLFDDYAEPGVDLANPFIKYLNLEQFTRMAMDKEYFGFRAQQAFCQSKDIDKDFLQVQVTLPQILTLFKSRLIAVELNTDFEFLELLENFQTCIKYPFSPRVGWLSYRVVDEIIKRVYLKRMSDNFMPLDMKQLGIKVRPAQSLLNSLPLNFFDTLQ